MDKYMDRKKLLKFIGVGSAVGFLIVFFFCCFIIIFLFCGLNASNPSAELELSDVFIGALGIGFFSLLGGVIAGAVVGAGFFFGKERIIIIPSIVAGIISIYYTFVLFSELLSQISLQYIILILLVIPFIMIIVTTITLKLIRNTSLFLPFIIMIFSCALGLLLIKTDPQNDGDQVFFRASVIFNACLFSLIGFLGGVLSVVCLKSEKIKGWIKKQASRLWRKIMILMGSSLVER